MKDTTIINGDSTDAEIMLPESELEDGITDQIQTMVDHEAFQNDVAIMPDTHVGSGAVIGFTMPLGDRVVPNTIGVDIGCGMYAASFGQVPYGEATLRGWDKSIREEIPMGFNHYDDQEYEFESMFPWDATTLKLEDFECQKGRLSQTSLDGGKYNMEYFEDLCERVGYDKEKAEDSLGTLGGGNHFIELGHSEITGLWAVVHSGSRKLGLMIANHHQERAEELRSMEKLTVHNIPEDLREYATDNLKPKADKIRENFDGTEIKRAFDSISQARSEAVGSFNDDLAYLEGGEVDQYYVDMIFAQMYASESRKLMMDKVSNIIGRIKRESVESVHNFIDFEDLTIRKGATKASEGEIALIPFNMRDGTLLIRGSGNDEWNNSAPHGAGRIMSRNQAFSNLSLNEFKSTMDGIESSSVTQETLDEAPMAYKSDTLIENAIQPTAEILDRIEPVLNIKAE